MQRPWTEEEIERVREQSRIRALQFQPHPQAPIILKASRELLIRLVEVQGLRHEVEEQVGGTLEACDLERLQRFLAFTWEPESIEEGADCLRFTGLLAG